MGKSVVKEKAPAKRQCAAKTKSGEQCRRPPMTGLKMCFTHYKPAGEKRQPAKKKEDAPKELKKREPKVKKKETPPEELEKTEE